MLTIFIVLSFRLFLFFFFFNDTATTEIYTLSLHERSSDLVGLVPRAVPRDEDRVAILGGEHLSGIEAHAERGGMRAEQRHRRLELAARAAPAELIVGNIALMAIGVAEMLARLGDPVELVVRQLLRQPVAAVVGEVELLGHRMEIEADRIAHAAHIGFRAAAVEIDAPDLAVGLGRQADVTGRADIDVELVVWPHRDEFPAMRLVIGELVVDDDRLRRIVEIVLDLLELRDPGAFGDVERAVVEGEAVGPIQAGGKDLELALAVLLDHGDRKSTRLNS